MESPRKDKLLESLQTWWKNNFQVYGRDGSIQELRKYLTYHWPAPERPQDRMANGGCQLSIGRCTLYFPQQMYLGTQWSRGAATQIFSSFLACFGLESDLPYDPFVMLWPTKFRINWGLWPVTLWIERNWTVIQTSILTCYSCPTYNDFCVEGKTCVQEGKKNDRC